MVSTANHNYSSTIMDLAHWFRSMSVLISHALGLWLLDEPSNYPALCPSTAFTQYVQAA